MHNKHHFLKQAQTKASALALSLGLLFGILAGCQAKETVPSQPSATTLTYQDGEYEAESSVQDERGGTAKVKLTIAEGQITAVDFQLYDAEGKLKDESYGEASHNPDLYAKAQAALKAAKEYSDQLIATQDLDKVDAIAGATWNYDLFKNVVALALEKAAKGDTSASKKVKTQVIKGCHNDASCQAEKGGCCCGCDQATSGTEAKCEKCEHCQKGEQCEKCEHCKECEHCEKDKQCEHCCHCHATEFATTNQTEKATCNCALPEPSSSVLAKK